MFGQSTIRWIGLAVALAAICGAAPAVAEGPEVTVLRGSSAPQEPVALPAPVERTVVEYRYVPAPQVYPVYAMSVLPVVVLHRRK